MNAPAIRAMLAVVSPAPPPSVGTPATAPLVARALAPSPRGPHPSRGAASHATGCPRAATAATAASGDPSLPRTAQHPTQFGQKVHSART